MNKVREISHFQEYQTKFWDHCYNQGCHRSGLKNKDNRETK